MHYPKSKLNSNERFQQASLEEEAVPKGPERIISETEKGTCRKLFEQAVRFHHFLFECGDADQALRFETYLNWHFENEHLPIRTKVIRTKELNCFQMDRQRKILTPQEVMARADAKKRFMTALIAKWGIKNGKQRRYYSKTKRGTTNNPYWKPKTETVKEGTEKPTIQATEERS